MDEGFVRRTYRSAAWVTAFVLFVLGSYGQFWALLPVLSGALFGTALLYGMEVFVRRTFTAGRAGDAKKKGSPAGPGGALLGFALVKYPLVALLIWAVVRIWDLRHVMAFTGGFILIQAVIALRGAGRYLVDHMNENSSASGKPAAGWKE
jgi:uncharacterized membrane protein YqjE